MSEYGSRYERLRSGTVGSGSPPQPSEHLTLAEWVLSRDDAGIFKSASLDEATPQIATPRLAAEDWQRIHRGLTSSSRPPPLRIKTAVDISPVSRSLTRRPSAPASLTSGPTAGVYSRSAPGLMEAGASPPTFGPSLDSTDMPLPRDGHEQKDNRNPDALPHDPPSSSTVAPHTPPPLPSAPDSRMWQPTTPAASSSSKVEREIAEIIALQGHIAGSKPDEPPSEEALARFEELQARLEELQSREADGAGDGANDGGGDDGGGDDGGGDDGLFVTGVPAGEPEKTEASTTDRPGHFAITTPTPAGKHRVAQRRHSSASIESSMSPFVGEHAQPPQQQSVPCSPSFRPTLHTETPSGFSPVPSPCPQPKTSAGKKMNKHTNQPSKRRWRILPTIKLLVWFSLLLASLFIFHPPHHLPATYLSYPSLLTPTASSLSDPHTRAPTAALIDALLPTPSQAATTMTTGTMELALRLAAVIAGHRAFLAVQGFVTAASPAGSKISDPDLARQHAGLVELEGAIQEMVGLGVGIGGWENGAGVDIKMERMRARMVRIAGRLSLRPGEGGDGVNAFVEEYLRGVMGWERG